MASIDMGKIEVYFGRLRSDIAKDVVMRDYAPIFYLKTLGQTLRLEAMR